MPYLKWDYKDGVPASMARIKVNNLETGRDLSKDAVDPRGRLLLKAGTTIEEKHIEVFRAWGVIEVEVVGDDEPNQEPSEAMFSTLPSEIQEQINLHIERLFSRNDLNHPLIKELIAYQKGKLSKRYFHDRGPSS